MCRNAKPTQRATTRTPTATGYYLVNCRFAPSYSVVLYLLVHLSNEKGTNEEQILEN